MEDSKTVPKTAEPVVADKRHRPKTPNEVIQTHEHSLKLIDAITKSLQEPLPSQASQQPQAKKDTRAIGLRNVQSGDTHSVGVNPKDKIGATKVDLTLIPGSAQIELALALMDGATKYGPYNWRVEPVQLRTYVGALQRHALDFLDGSDTDITSLCKHMGHVMACAAIIIDAMRQGTFVDDRPISRALTEDHMIEANEWIKTQKPEGWGR